MSIIYLLLPASLILASIAVLGYMWATKSGQFDDLDTPALRMLNEDEQIQTTVRKKANIPTTGETLRNNLE